jgi:hypothetical protein
VRAIEDDAWSKTLRHRPYELEARKAELERQLNAARASPSTIRLHPNAANIYCAQVSKLEVALNTLEICAEAADALRLLIKRVVLTPDETESRSSMALAGAAGSMVRSMALLP